MEWVERSIKWLFPTIILDGSPWKAEWEASQRLILVKIFRVFCPVVAAIYVGHYFFFDKPEGLTPIEGWFAFRTTVAVLLLLSFLFYCSPLAQTRWYRIPAIIVTALLCFLQAFVTYYYPPAPWIYPFVFAIIFIFILRMSALQSTLYALTVSIAIFPILREAGLDTGSLISASIVVLVMAAFSRSSYAFEINNFLLNKENAQQQDINFKLQREFSDRIKSFIPKVIAQRIQRQIDEDGVSVMEASVGVLRATEKEVACLFSDIRGFTAASKDLAKFVHNSVLPEAKAASDAVEAYRGIPRKIGDLIFAYFDEESIEENIVCATLAGIALSRVNRDMNETVSEIQIQRYILISSGKAIVGNLGGVDSSVEITALGSPVNFLSRLDEATKEPGLARMLSPGDILMCENSASILTSVNQCLRIQAIDLEAINVTIRDFPETRKVFSLKPSEDHLNQLKIAFGAVESRYVS